MKKILLSISLIIIVILIMIFSGTVLAEDKICEKHNGRQICSLENPFFDLLNLDEGMCYNDGGPVNEVKKI